MKETSAPRASILRHTGAFEYFASAPIIAGKLV
jgi:hypothetical protein